MSAIQVTHYERIRIREQALETARMLLSSAHGQTFTMDALIEQARKIEAYILEENPWSGDDEPDEGEDDLEEAA